MISGRQFLRSEFLQAELTRKGAELVTNRTLFQLSATLGIRTKM